MSMSQPISPIKSLCRFVRFIDDSEIQEKVSAAKSCPKQAMAKIYSMFGLPCW